MDISTATTKELNMEGIFEDKGVPKDLRERTRLRKNPVLQQIGY